MQDTVLKQKYTSRDEWQMLYDYYKSLLWESDDL